MLQRPEYLAKLIGYKDKELIKVVTGIRRCGKSTLLELYRLWLMENGVEQDQIQSVNFEDMEYSHLTDHKALHKYILEHCAQGKMNYIFLDEIQHVDEFQRAGFQ